MEAVKIGTPKSLDLIIMMQLIWSLSRAGMQLNFVASFTVIEPQFQCLRCFVFHSHVSNPWPFASQPSICSTYSMAFCI
jgi:hypothetical protein